MIAPTLGSVARDAVTFNEGSVGSLSSSHNGEIFINVKGEIFINVDAVVPAEYARAFLR